MKNEEEHTPLIQFNLGFELGAIWQMMANGDDVHTHIIYKSNIARITDICTAYGYKLELLLYECDEGKVLCNITKKFEHNIPRQATG